MKSAAFCLLGLLLFFVAPAFASFHDNGNGTVTDSETGLTWQKAADSTAKNWQESLAACANLTLGGQSDWRLPNRNELQSIVDYRYADPAIDSNFFPSTSGTFWTSTTVADSPSSAYNVDFNSGAVSYNDKASGSFQVRAVRGGVTPVQPPSFFYNNGNGTVTDSRTGLVWRQVPLDADGNGAADALNWQEALAAATRLDFAGQTDWRLPNRNELQSIIDYRYADPALDSNFFPKVTGGTFWTSTTVADSPSTAYTVDFNSGAVSYNDKASGKYSVLTVRSRASISTGAFKFFGIPDKVTANSPFAVEVIANDSAFNGTVHLYLQDGGGIDPASVTLANGRWKGNISIARPGKTRLIALHAPLNGDFLYGSSEWFEVTADQNINADLQVMIIEDKAVYSQGDTLGYSIYVKNFGKDDAPDVTIDLTSTEGFDLNAASCSGYNSSICQDEGLKTKFTASIHAGQYVTIRADGQARAGYNSITLTTEAHDAAVHDRLETNNRAVSVITTDLPDLPGSRKAELRILPGSSSNPAAVDTVVLTHGLQDLSCDAEELWTSSKSDPAKAGYLIQQAMEKAGKPVNIYQFFWQGACQEHYHGIPLDVSYQGAYLNVNAAAQYLAKQLLDKLGPNYDKKIHFIGHSLGTAVNAYAAKIFLTKATKVSTAQVTILDHPNHIGKIAGFIWNDDESEKQWGFDENFFANTLPFDRPGLTFYVDNYYSAYSDKNKVKSGGVGSAINGHVFNHDALVDSFQVGDELLSDESAIFGIDNDHSGVQQWYRWTMRPKEEENFTGDSVCNDAGTWNGKPGDIDPTLNPCKEKRGGWRESILLHDTIDFPPFNGAAADKKSETVGTSSNPVLHGCISFGPLIATTCSEPAKAALSPSAAVHQTTALAEEPQIPNSSIEFTVTVPEFLRYISFDYSFGNLGDGDYVYIFLDGVPVWKMSGGGLTAGETVSSGLIPVRATAGQKKLIIALYGVGEQNAQFSLNNFKFTTVADTDSDGIADDEDAFPNNPSEWLDTDKDGIGNNADLDDDNDGLNDAAEQKTGCADALNADTDGDGLPDGVEDANHNGVLDPGESSPCLKDTDGDGTLDQNDQCPADKNKTAPGQCGCGTADTDSDRDGISDCKDPDTEKNTLLPGVLQLLLKNKKR